MVFSLIKRRECVSCLTEGYVFKEMFCGTLPMNCLARLNPVYNIYGHIRLKTCMQQVEIQFRGMS